MDDLFAKQELREMRKTSRQVYKVVVRVLREEIKTDFVLRLKPTDRIRLDILQVWAERHHVTLDYTIRTVLAFWRSRPFMRKKKKKGLLGVTVASLTSPKSEVILEQAILRDFPDGQNVSEFRQRARLHLLGLDGLRGRARSLINEKTPDESCIMYASRIERRQTKLSNAEASESRRRRKWRGNPWL
jgi:hypothetical protein